MTLSDSEKIKISALRAAGWQRVGSGQTWQSPHTGVCLQLKQAWQVMQARKAVMEFAEASLNLTQGSRSNPSEKRGKR